jgi:hypothetical protein
VVASTGSMLRISAATWRRGARLGETSPCHHTKVVAFDAQQVQQLSIPTMKDRPAYLGLYALALLRELCFRHLVLMRSAQPAIVESNGVAPSLEAISWRGTGKRARIPGLCIRLVSQPEPHTEGMAVATRLAAPTPPAPQAEREAQDREIAHWPPSSPTPQCCQRA